MALSRRTGQRFQASIWPGFVDAMTGLLLVLMFVLTIFMVVQFVLRETITGQETELDALSAEVAALAQALGLEQQRAADLTDQVGTLRSTLSSAQERVAEQVALISALTTERDAQATALTQAQTRITSFEAQVAALISERDQGLVTIADLEGTRDTLLSEQEALNLALAQARTEIDVQLEEARLAAARREALEALVADLETRETDLQAELSEQELARIADAAAAEALQERLKNADAELTAMTLALEAQRKKAEETLTLLAAAETASEDLDIRLAAALISQEDAQSQLASALLQTEETAANAATKAAELAAAQTDLEGAQATLAEQQAEIETQRANLSALEARLAKAIAARLQTEDTLNSNRDEVAQQLAAALAARKQAEADAEIALTEAQERAALLATAQASLADEQEQSSEAQRRAVVLNQQVAALREQLAQLQALLDDSRDRDVAAQVQLQTLGSDLNAALARVAAEERKRRLAEEERTKLLEAQAQDLEKYRSEFFGRLRDVLGVQDGVQIVGDRFIFSSEVLFPPGGADLSREGETQIARIAETLRDIANEIPAEINWVLQVDGHTDNIPLIGGARYADNWELSQARALSVVRYMVDFLELPPEHLSANGFGQYQPIDLADTAQARARNRRIELKFTEK